MVDPSDAPPLEGYRRVQEFFTAWRERTAELTGAPVHLNWFFRMDPQIAASYGDPRVFVDQHPEFIERVRDAGDGLGVHPHAWRWDRANDGWVADLANPAFVRECLDTAVDAFRTSIGHPPELLRYGDAYLDDDIVDAAEHAGIRYDLTARTRAAGEARTRDGRRRGGDGLAAGLAPGTARCRTTPRPTTTGVLGARPVRSGWSR